MDVDLDDLPEPQIEFPCCPTCGQRTKIGANPEWLMPLFRGNMVAILATLANARRERRSASLTELCRNVYHDDPKGGPLWGPNTIQQAIVTSQAKLIERGWMIVGPKTTGNGYQLVPIDAVEGVL
jgi:hypothetical protein